MASRDNSEFTSTIEEFIRSKSNDIISYDKFSIFEKVNSIYMITHNVLNDYIVELKRLALTVALTDEQFDKYQYKPKLLAYDIYGTPELYFVILAINDMCDVKQFSKRKIKMIKVDKLQEVLSYIYQSQSNILNLNNTNIMG